MAVESLCKKTPYFVEGKKRPQEALFTLYKIGCFLKSLQRTAGNSFLKYYLKA
jgi:hypothetical protein